MADTPSIPLLTTPLTEEHIALGARMVGFAGYSMPVQYQSVIAESKAVREGAGMFDVSHMARLILTGDKVLEYLEWITSNDVSKLTDGKGQYSLLPNSQGGTVDDIIVYRITENEFRMVVNASNHAKDVSHITNLNTFAVEIQDVTNETAMIAVQGPKAKEVLAKMSDQPETISLADLFDVVHCKIAEIECFAPCSGYTGEDGFELICASDKAASLWKALLGAGVAPCGLGSRDVLRVEAGLPLYGHELDDDRSPLEAGLGWVISKTKSFVGSEPINQVRAEGAKTKLVGVQLEGKRLPLAGMEVRVDGKAVGVISSGIYSPLLEKGAAFAFVASETKLGVSCVVEMRGKEEPGTLVNKRFFKRA
ncbi:MAG: glycine cleavage system aminomethyltransferase GcvT [Fimbriimonadaceae bacterium]|jgi:aminomethyltransferase|nr:glycine cleavage system aminomethyltransferase GcvT [Fimbriimonadaceae bacterium]